MDSQAVKTAGTIAGIVVVLGVLAIGAQYLGQLSSGASAQVVDPADVPMTITVSKEDYISMQSLLAQYEQFTDLARKNAAIQELRLIFDRLPQ